MARLAIRNLFQGKVRLLMSTGGLALALLLVLTLDAIFTGAEAQTSAYIDSSAADVWVAQAGVRNMHMASSTLPVSAIDQVQAVPGVRSVTPILYMTAGIDTGRESHVAYIIGLPPDPAAGGPWHVTSGHGVPGPGEAVIDRSIATSSGVGIGSAVTIVNRPFRVAGLTDGTLNIVSSVAFISLADFMQIRGSTESVSYLLVRIAQDESAASVAAAIDRQVAGVTALSRPAFSAEERNVVAAMSTDLVAIMNLIGLLIGLAVMALSIYTSTLARRSEYGVLKAVGARNRDLYGVVVIQAVVALALGLVTSVLLTMLLSRVMPVVAPGLAMELSTGSVVKVAAMALVIATLAAVLPVRQIAGLDPAVVFRRRAA